MLCTLFSHLVCQLTLLEKGFGGSSNSNEEEKNTPVQERMGWVRAVKGARVSNCGVCFSPGVWLALLLHRTASPSAMLGWWVMEEEEGLLRWREEVVVVERGTIVVRERAFGVQGTSTTVTQVSGGRMEKKH